MRDFLIYMGVDNTMGEIYVPWRYNYEYDKPSLVVAIFAVRFGIFWFLNALSLIFISVRLNHVFYQRIITGKIIVNHPDDEFARLFHYL